MNGLSRCQCPRSLLLEMDSQRLKILVQGRAGVQGSDSAAGSQQVCGARAALWGPWVMNQPLQRAGAQAQVTRAAPVKTC